MKQKELKIFEKSEEPIGIPVGPNNGGPICMVVNGWNKRGRRISDWKEKKEIIKEAEARISKEFPEAYAFKVGESHVRETTFMYGSACDILVAVQAYKA